MNSVLGINVPLSPDSNAQCGAYCQVLALTPKLLEGRTYVLWGFGDTTTHEISKVAGMYFV